jgi:RNA polymerase sigma factor (TIGR02999 family)
VADSDVTGLLIAWSNGDRNALDALVPLVHAELHRIARHRLRGERVDHTLQPTALVNEVYLRLVDLNRLQWQNRAHFFAVTARLMRQVLMDAARHAGAAKRGAGAVRVTLDEALLAADRCDVDVLALDEALQALAANDARKCQVIEMRFFAGLTVEETAQALDVSPDTVSRDWKFARAWLRVWLDQHAADGDSR